MKVIGLHFTKISAEKLQDFKKEFTINTNIEFLEIEKEEVSIELPQDIEPTRVNFKFSVNYNTEEKKNNNLAKVVLEGIILLHATKDESKDLLKAWKKKEIPNDFKVPMFNFILKKMFPKSSPIGRRA